MAGMEQLEVHSKSYIIRWVKVDDGHTISWSVQPHKKSINFGIFKHPGTGAAPLTKVSSASEDSVTTSTTSTAGGDNGSDSKPRAPAQSRNEQSTAQEQLRSKGFIRVEWFGKYEADKVNVGSYAVQPGRGGMYGLVFDNTFSKTVSKTATFVLLTYPSNAPPSSAHNLQNNIPGSSGSGGSSSNSKAYSPLLGAAATNSVDSLNSHSATGPGASRLSLPRADSDNHGTNHHVGVLQKRRRKRGQGYARRFFSLDFNSCTLSYYYNRNSSALRGAIPLSLAAITADERRREISIDSGAEIWHLKANNQKDFDDWARALEKASRIARGPVDGPRSSAQALKIQTSGLGDDIVEQGREWAQVEALVSRVAGTRDAIQRLAKDTNAPKRHVPSQLSMTPTEESSEYLTPATEKKSFWRRKSNATPPQPTLHKSPSLQFSGGGSTVTTITANGGNSNSRPKSTHQRTHSQQESNIHEHCLAMVKDLDSVLAEFATLLSKSKRRRNSRPLSALSRMSIDSTSTAEFYDAEAGDTQDDSQLLRVHQRSDDGASGSEAEDEFVSDGLSLSSADEEDKTVPLTGTASLFPVKPKSLTPLPITNPIKRRKVVPTNTTPPPSLIGFLRKNVGKDLSTISMHVTSNEPLSLLQRSAELLEYSQLLDSASQQKNAHYRLLYVTAFAISNFSNSRSKERAIRKPFNPMLGETYELVRGEAEVPGNFRMVAEKVSHRPVRLALQADSANWSLAQSPAPTQKFWGKSAELTTDGRVRVVLRLADGTEELYSWQIATAFLRNVVMGEKYLEPVGTMSVANETTGARACIEFRTRGMFSGRSEDIMVETLDAKGVNTGYGLAGTWTNSLSIVESGKNTGSEIWKVGPLVDGSNQRYGFTNFAATLNEITPLEEGKLPPTDCRLRPDQRKAEEGDFDTAEDLKTQLEQAQRERRKEMENRGEVHRPRWFTRVDCDGEEIWRLKGGKDGYWEERARGKWEGVENIFALEQ